MRKLSYSSVAALARMLRQRGLSGDEIDRGLNYCTEHGAAAIREGLTLAMLRALSTDTRPAAGMLFLYEVRGYGSCGLSHKLKLPLHPGAARTGTRMSGTKKTKPMIVIRKEEVIEAGHHGGAWKVAYADFVTAMMAFFLLMWLLNATTQEQKRGLADYFSPNNLMARTTSGFGQPFGGTTPNVDGSLASDRGAVQLVMGPTHPVIDADEAEGDLPATPAPLRVSGPSLMAIAQDGGPGGTAAALAAAPATQAGAAREATPPLDDKAQAERERTERRVLEQAAEQIKEAVRSDPALAAFAKQLAIDLLPEGLRIQLLDEDRTPMFAFGASALSERARALLAKVAPVLLRLPEGIAIDGHTDGAPYRGGDRSNWDLSAERANATRRLLTDAGVPEGRIRSVAGRADRDLLLRTEPLAAANRRVVVMVLRDLPAVAAR